MKSNQILKSVLGFCLFIAVLSFSSCSSGENKSATTHSETEHAGNEAVSEMGNPQFSDEKVKEVYQHYIHLKDALVKSDAKEAQAGAAALQTALSNAGNSAAADLAGKIASAGKIEDQRSQFDGLTSEVEKTIKGSKLSSGKIFKQYCPMANSNEGGYWLASESDIRNPYYGDEMLECGEVKEEIK